MKDKAWMRSPDGRETKEIAQPDLVPFMHLGWRQCPAPENAGAVSEEAPATPAGEEQAK